MITYKPHKYPPQAERAEGLKRTIINSIVQKLERMDMEQLKEMHSASIQMFQRQTAQK